MNAAKIRERGERRLSARRTMSAYDTILVELMRLHRAPVVEALRDAESECKRLREELDALRLSQAAGLIAYGCSQRARRASELVAR